MGSSMSKEKREKEKRRDKERRKERERKKEKHSSSSRSPSVPPSSKHAETAPKQPPAKPDSTYAEPVVDAPTKKHPSLAITTAETDKDPAIAKETIAKLRQELEKTREEQRMVVLLKKKDQYAKLVATGKLTKEEAERAFEKDMADDKCGVDAPLDDNTPRILVGKANLPTNRGQQWTSRNPYELEGSDVEDVGQQPANIKPVFVKIRIDRNLIIMVEQIGKSSPAVPR